MLDVVEADVWGGRQERRRTPKHRRDLPTPPQAERQPAAEEGQADVSGQEWSNSDLFNRQFSSAKVFLLDFFFLTTTTRASHICYFLTYICRTHFSLRHHQRQPLMGTFPLMFPVRLKPKLKTDLPSFQPIRVPIFKCFILVTSRLCCIFHFEEFVQFR